MKSLRESGLNKSPKNILFDLIKMVLKNRLDIEPDKDFIHNVANYTLEQTQAASFISECLILQSASINAPEDYRLGQIIELIAIVNRAIDIISLNSCPPTQLLQ